MLNAKDRLRAKQAKIVNQDQVKQARTGDKLGNRVRAAAFEGMREVSAPRTMEER